MLRQPRDVVQLTHWQSGVVTHESHAKVEHPSESGAADAPIRATATVKNTTLKYMTAANLSSCLHDGEHVSDEKRR